MIFSCTGLTILQEQVLGVGRVHEFTALPGWCSVSEGRSDFSCWGFLFKHRILITCNLLFISRYSQYYCIYSLIKTLNVFSSRVEKSLNHFISESLGWGKIEDTSLQVKNYFCISIEVLRGLVKYDVTAVVSFTSFYHLLTIALP